MLDFKLPPHEADVDGAQGKWFSSGCRSRWGTDLLVSPRRGQTHSCVLLAQSWITMINPPPFNLFSQSVFNSSPRTLLRTDKMFGTGKTCRALIFPPSFNINSRTLTVKKWNKNKQEILFKTLVHFNYSKDGLMASSVWARLVLGGSDHVNAGAENTLLPLTDI